MASTVRTDMIVPEVLQDAISTGFGGCKILAGSPACTVNDRLPDVRGGDRVKVPYFANLGELDDVAEDTGLTTTKLTMSSEEATVSHAGKSFELTQWAQMAAQMHDPYGEASRQVVEASERRFDKALIDAAKDSLPASMVKNVFDQTTPRKIDYDAVVDAKMLWGDEQEDIVMMCVHSKTYGDMQKLKTTDGVPLLTLPQDGSIPRFLGIPVFVSDRIRSDHPTVVEAGTSPPDVTIAGEGNNADVRIEITTGGARGTAVFKYSLDGGASWATGITTAATVTLGSSGLEANFATGSNYSTDNVYVSKPRHQTLLLKRGALVLWYAGKPSVQAFHDVAKDNDLAAIHVYFVGYRYKVLPGKTKGGVVILKHN